MGKRNRSLDSLNQVAKDISLANILRDKPFSNEELSIKIADAMRKIIDGDGRSILEIVFFPKQSSP